MGVTREIRCAAAVTVGTVVFLAAGAVLAASSANRPPRWLPGNVVVTNDNQYEVINGVPVIVSAAPRIKLTRGATDPDGDRVKYRWAATNGKITGKGLTATWVRVVPEPGFIKPGVVSVTALDGRGGRAVRKIVFK
jgi:hypothetical protein